MYKIKYSYKNNRKVIKLEIGISSTFSFYQNHNSLIYQFHNLFLPSHQLIMSTYLFFSESPVYLLEISTYWGCRNIQTCLTILSVLSIFRTLLKNFFQFYHLQIICLSIIYTVSTLWIPSMI